MKLLFKKSLPLIGFLLIILLSSFKVPAFVTGFSLKVDVNGLRNSEGSVVFALYNKNDAFPDEHYEKYLVMLTGKIVNGASSVTFENLPEGKYAVNILHDEDNDGKIKKGMVLPKEGIGFSNYQSISIFNRPNFRKASFDLEGDKEILVSIIYL
ncbi:MAG: hypothetical protein CVT99_01050 [Bacteroidetes bacterium HGW-Bacteroidetes-16]|jgi:uncharacterized protein (DUF2141 family)|nr:MAG: hypothetical protein CVT99_01050 [Bacteroidetes bacterium HGW-Bacteroidetes-16]